MHRHKFIFRRPRFAVLMLFSCLMMQGPLWASDEINQAKTFKELDDLFRNAHLDVKAPSLVYGVVAGGELIHSGRFGQAKLSSESTPTDQTAYRIASMTKMMTALLVLDLQDQGLLYLDAPAESYVKALASLEYPTRDSRKITVRDLLNHTSGFVTDDPWADRQMARSNAELDEFLARIEPFTFSPGEAFQYSNLGFTLLGRIIENVSGHSFSNQMQNRLLKPLGMSNTTLDLNTLSAEQRAGAYNWVDGEYLVEPVLESGAFDPLGGIWTTVEDYGKFVSWMLSAWPARDDPETTPIPRRVVRSVTDGVYLMGASQGSGLNSDSDCLMGSAYSMGLSIRKHCEAGLVLTHGGGFPGFGSYVLIMPDKGIGVFSFANETYAAVYGPVWDAARVLMASSLGREAHQYSADPRLMKAYEAIFVAYSSADIQATNQAFADNFFLDRSKERWNRQLEAIQSEAGECVLGDFVPGGRLSGGFEWSCESARVAGYLVQSPLNPADIQKLHLRVVRRDGNGNDLVIDPDFH
jgi:D-alanyl-D-alanine-carboxypeptidase/D-alanyl-D-alanine-endopeptidase